MILLDVADLSDRRAVWAGARNEIQPTTVLDRELSEYYGVGAAEKLSIEPKPMLTSSPATQALP
ncbi:hypothetical protein GS506_16290 [Rhodococcus hoagii]|nr:hypothetical protein [Prescottella equi]